MDTKLDEKVKNKVEEKMVSYTISDERLTTQITAGLEKYNMAEKIREQVQAADVNEKVKGYVTDAISKLPPAMTEEMIRDLAQGEIKGYDYRTITNLDAFIQNVANNQIDQRNFPNDEKIKDMAKQHVDDLLTRDKGKRLPQLAELVTGIAREEIRGFEYKDVSQLGTFINEQINSHNSNQPVMNEDMVRQLAQGEIERYDYQNLSQLGVLINDKINSHNSNQPVMNEDMVRQLAQGEILGYNYQTNTVSCLSHQE
ncbi:hypothetical protein FACS189472_18230 [Alphaproteobacteria bacterium]|nr:hypothetical protein FACS189472_18230 [Alphaproteobacteria bacterium]